ncbi:MAG TPA: hypothetical protein VFW05_08200 [Verrucomicrobiae bacterium]|nr:hypothetical protein [Verrucomicrobiae bacterium]
MSLLTSAATNMPSAIYIVKKRPVDRSEQADMIATRQCGEGEDQWS